MLINFSHKNILDHLQSKGLVVTEVASLLASSTINSAGFCIYMAIMMFRNGSLAQLQNHLEVQQRTSHQPLKQQEQGSPNQPWRERDKILGWSVFAIFFAG